jgi:hypothetical protein
MGLANDGGCDHGAILAERHGNGLESADACHMNDLVNERMKGVAMGLFTNLVLGLVHLLLVAVDLLFVLLLARMLSFRWHTRWLAAINTAGQPYLDWLTRQIERTLGHVGQRAPSERIVLFVGMVAISLIRLLLAGWLAGERYL